jgi:hypothetical protein
MTRRSRPKFVVYCILSHLATGCAEEGRIFDTSLSGSSRTTLPSLMDGDHLTLKISIPEHHRPVMVKLAKVNWVQGSRFGVELLIMDADDRGRLGRLIGEHLPLAFEFQDSRPELIITAAD